MVVVAVPPAPLLDVLALALVVKVACAPIGVVTLTGTVIMWPSSVTAVAVGKR